MKPRLVRFRADPRKVRVGVRPQNNGVFQVTIGARDGSCRVFAFATSPKKALVKALQRAEREQLPGLDMSMGWAYEHPWLRGGP